MTKNNYDVIIVGAGPAGIFAAYELTLLAPETTVLLIEKGKDIDKRVCPMHENDIPCINCQPYCSIMTGWGGAGVTRGLAQSGASGIIVAREIVERMKKK